MASTTRGYSPDPGQEFRVVVNAWNRHYGLYHSVGGDILCQRWTTFNTGPFGLIRTTDWKDFPADHLEVHCTITGERNDHQGQGSRSWIATAQRTHYCAHNMWAFGFNLTFETDRPLTTGTGGFPPDPNPGPGPGPLPRIDAKRVVVSASVRIGGLTLTPTEPAVWEG